MLAIKKAYLALKDSNLAKIIAAFIGMAILSLLPFLLTGYWIRILTSMFMVATLAKGIDFMMGYTGYVPFGNVVFFGLGAYTTGILMSSGFSFILAMLIGGLISSALCVFVGLPVLRLRGHYFAIATIGVNGTVLAIALNATNLTGGAMGLNFPLIQQPPGILYNYFYFAMLGLMVFTIILNIILLRSKFGFAVRSIKSNETAAEALGINTTLYKTSMWVISAVLTSFAGAIYGYWMSYVSTGDVFNIMKGVEGILMVLLGSVGTVLGPIVGAFAYKLLSEVVWSNFLEYHKLILGLLMIFVLLFLPKGIVTTTKNWLTAKLGVDTEGGS